MNRRALAQTRLRWVVAATFLWAVHPAHGRPRPAPHFTLSADTALVDEPIGIVLVGVAPSTDVTVRATGLGSATGWHASATYRSDSRGRIDVTRVAPIHGDYTGAHAMGLFWGARPDSGAKPLFPFAVRSLDAVVPPPQPWEVVAEVGGQAVARDTVWRRALSPTVSMSAVGERGLVGTLYVPSDTGRHPAVIVLTGSDGGIAPPNGIPGGLASRGYVVLALGYFAVEGRPAKLANIPLEYFGTALRWLVDQPVVDSTRVSLVGTSRGAELVLLLGATYPLVHSVVAYLPSSVAWPGTLMDSTRQPAWTLGGKPVPGIYTRETDSAVARHAGCPNAPTCRAPLTRHQFLALLDDSAAAARAEIPVERIHGALLLISGRDDGIWPSTPMADRVMSRLRQHRFPYAYEHHSYDSAGHAISRRYFPTPDVGDARRHPVTGRMVVAGGTPEGTALASEDSWQRVLAFLAHR